MRLTLIILLIFILGACGTSSKIDLTNIVNVKLEYSALANINNGSQLPVRIMAVMSDGSEKDISNNKIVTVTSNRAVYDEDAKILNISMDSPNFSSPEIVVNMLLTQKEEELSYTETIQLNYNGDLLLDFSGKDGANGEDGGDKGSRLVFRDGKDGEHGENGVNGGNGEDIIVNLWKEDNFYYCRVLFRNTGVKQYYKTDLSGKVKVDVSGGNGGNAGNGGDGGNGKDGNTAKDKTPGEAGDGGNGGHGGTGGNAGSAQVIIHTNASELEANTSIWNDIGNGGTAGNAGVKGEPGDPDANQDPLPEGADGINGTAGANGINNGTTSIKVEEFVTQLMKP